MEHDQTPELANLQDAVRHIDDFPDPLHTDLTPAVWELISHGAPAARLVLDLLDAPERKTRVHAQRVVEGVVMQQHGFKPGRGYADPAAEYRVRDLLTANGNYDPDLPPEQRRAAIARWRAYFEKGATP